MRVIIHYPKPIKQLSSQKLPLLVDGKIAGTVTQGKILSLYSVKIKNSGSPVSMYN